MEFLQAADDGTLFWFELHHYPWLTGVMKAASWVGEPERMTVIALLGILLFWLAGRRRQAYILLVIGALTLALGEGVKAVVDRQRPDVAWRLIPRPSGSSFPSGHALGSLSILGSIAVLTARRLRRRGLRSAVRAVGFGLPILIGVSRPYLGVHYPLDVVGGWTAGLACVFLAEGLDLLWGSADRYPAKVSPPEPASQPQGSGEHKGEPGASAPGFLKR
jgi:membrane-associated phospholipid phosphatase